MVLLVFQHMFLYRIYRRVRWRCHVPVHGRCVHISAATVVHDRVAAAPCATEHPFCSGCCLQAALHQQQQRV